MFNRLSFQARFDAATSHSNGTATNGMLTEDHPERKRITVGSKAASFKRVIAVAAVGVFIGASMSNGMMDIGRSLVRTTLNAHAWVNEHAPAKLRKWVNRRMDNRVPVMLGGGVLAVLLLVRSNNRFRNRKKEMPDETLFQTILTTGRPAEVWPLLRIYINEKQQMFLNFAADAIKLKRACHIRDIYEQLQKGDTDNMAATYVYLNMLQESQEFVTSLRKMLRASGKLNLALSTYRSFSHSAKPV